MRIKRLEASLANQIAAGEVVERPASVVKELVENSIDASATKITVEIEQGGQALIRVRDNGTGISEQDLNLAISRHATSKIRSQADLEGIHSLGFRGEALASIAAVSRLRVASMFANANSAYAILCAGSIAGDKPQICAHPQGTTVEVKDLFYNTPARRKFLRTVRTEFNQIETVLQRLALSRFDIAFTLKHNGKIIFNAPIADSQTMQEQRLREILGAEFINEAIFIEFAAANMQLKGWLALPNFTRGQADMQYFYINDRFVRDKLLAHAAKQAYHDVLFHGRHPAYVLYIKVDPKVVDVNVHPTKHEVRFRDGRSVHDFIARGVHDSLKQVRPSDISASSPAIPAATARRRLRRCQRR